MSRSSRVSDAGAALACLILCFLLASTFAAADLASRRALRANVATSSAMIAPKPPYCTTQWNMTSFIGPHSFVEWQGNFTGGTVYAFGADLAVEGTDEPVEGVFMLGSCTVLAARGEADVDALCTVQIVSPIGQVAAQGVMRSAQGREWALAITGGTGTYRGVQGEAAGTTQEAGRRIALEVTVAREMC
ncbi:hypothetical protein HYH03_011159 [Edaphochlamys debaryana]|uniref:Dirigent protein n=1 Tax=Edaphochlamys debaryana TaxID=47281 RepID=A0A835XVH3_9CHLO|nr:hypothetical protein HYH03_011159 [Edaphochlamys debaryana]|eukprot:KAG2490357.1 hypothetical protein HYH03_011159 [Edaphochlamys debaryana]